MRRLRHTAVALLVAVSLVGGPVSAAPIDVTTDERLAQRVPASPAPAATAALTGTVVDLSTNSPIGGATVTVRGAGASVTAISAGDGTFTLALPSGVYDIDATKGGFQAGQVASFAVVAGVTSTLRVPLSEANSNSLRTIGRVSLSRRSSLNSGTSATAVLDSATITNRDLPNLSDTVPELPGVTLSRTTGATANSFFVVRGANIETRVNIDGHPVSVGTFGNYNTNYAISTIFDQVEVLKGAGLGGPTAGEFVFGTINLRTRDFTSKSASTAIKAASAAPSATSTSLAADSVCSAAARIAATADRPNGANNQAYTLSLANSRLRPETTVAYDLGFDYRLGDGGIFSMDAYDNTVHNIFAAVSTPIAPVPNVVAAGGLFQNQTINGPIGRYHGIEAAFIRSMRRARSISSTASSSTVRSTVRVPFRSRRGTARSGTRASVTHS